MSGDTIVVRANFDLKPVGRGEAKDSTGRRSSGVASMLALAHHIERKIRDGQLRDYAHAAELLGMTRARISQISSLTLLAPAIQEAILDLPLLTDGKNPISERSMRAVSAEPDWATQLTMWLAFLEART